MLVHCAAGVSRSASIVIAYIMRQRHLPFAEARARVKVSAGMGLRCCRWVLIWSLIGSCTPDTLYLPVINRSQLDHIGLMASMKLDGSEGGMMGPCSLISS